MEEGHGASFSGWTIELHGILDDRSKHIRHAWMFQEWPPFCLLLPLRLLRRQKE
jgi:hypothetical protein